MLKTVTLLKLSVPTATLKRCCQKWERGGILGFGNLKKIKNP